ncbi:MAG: hypothetical protein ACFFED_09455 [Candidatus Thorarchaeota archaeon]
MNHRHIVEASLSVLLLICAGILFYNMPILTPGITSFQEIDECYLAGHPDMFEGARVTIRMKIASLIQENESHLYYISNEGTHLVCSFEIQQLHQGDSVVVRGVSWIVTKGYILVTELKVNDSLVSLRWSIPGVLLFIVLFFRMYRFSRSGMCFLRRDNSNA